MQLVRSADGTDIAFDCSGGDGPPVILVGGAFQDRYSMKVVATGLQDAFTVYKYDRRGRGDSGNTRPYAVEREVEDLAAVIEAAGEPAFVFGQSSGGALALEAAARAVPIRALVVNEPPYTDGPTSEFADDLDELVERGRRAEATAAFLELIGTPPTAVAELKAGPSWAHMQAFAPTLSHEIRLCNNGEVPTDRLADVPAPTLALAGETSPAWAHEAARAIAEQVRSGEAQVLAGQGHRIADDVLISVLSGSFSLQPVA
jgi:pimeloyl-ACP methyl ester carboxylesterase